MIRTVLLSFICVFINVQAYCQVPDAFQFQALIRNASGELVVNTNVSVDFKIHKASSTGIVIFSETHTNVNSGVSGVVNLQIGKGTSDTKFNEINWGDGPFFIETLINYGSGPVSIGTQQLLSVPFAQYAKNAKNVKLKSPNGKIWTVSVDNAGIISTKELTE